MQDLRTAAPALTALSEEENMFRDAVREFAETEVRAACPGDGRGGAVPARPDPQVLRARADGHRGAGAVRRRRRRDLHVGAGHRGAGPGGRVGRHLRGRPQHPGEQRLAPLGQRRAAAPLLPPAHHRPARRLRAVGARQRERRVRARDPGRARRRRLGAHRPEVLDHQRRRGGRVHRLRQRRLRPRATRASPASSWSASSPASRSARRRTSSASARRAPPSSFWSSAGCPTTNVLGPDRPGLQDRDRDPERGPDRDRGADDRRGDAARSRRRRPT